MSSASDIHSILYKGEDPLKKKFTPQCETRQKVKRLFPGKAPHYATGEQDGAAGYYGSDDECDHIGLALTPSSIDKRDQDAQKRRLARLERLQKAASGDSESSTDEDSSSISKQGTSGSRPSFVQSGVGELLRASSNRAARVLVKRSSRPVRVVPADSTTAAGVQVTDHGSDSMDAGSSDESSDEARSDDDEGDSRHTASRGNKTSSTKKFEEGAATAGPSSCLMTDDEIAARRQRLKERILEEQKKLELALVSETRKSGAVARLKSQEFASSGERERRGRRGDDASEGSMESGSSGESDRSSIDEDSSDGGERHTDSDSEGENDSDYDEESAVEFNRMRPVFLSTKERELLRQQRGLRDETEDSTYSEEARQALAEQRRKEAKRLLVETIKEEETEKRQQAANRNNLFNDDAEVVDDTDGIDPEAEHRAWREREIARNKRDNEERIERQRFLQEIERRRKMNEAERLDDDRRLDSIYGKTHLKKGGKYLFLQKYYHKGAFFQDQAASGEEPLYQRNFNEPVGEDKLDKKLLPAPMRLRRGQFGKAGQVKHTHLAEVDTTDLTAPVRIKYAPLRSGVKVRKTDL